MRAFLLIASIALVACQIAQVYCDDSSEASTTVTVQESAEEIAKLAADYDATEEQITERLQLVEEIKKLDIWAHFTTVQQERLRLAILKDTPVPRIWVRVRQYPEIIDPANAEFLQNLINKPWLLQIMMAGLPKGPNEWTIAVSEWKGWWKQLNECQQAAITRLILREKDVPEQWKSWAEAVKSSDFSKWIGENKAELFANECPA